MTPACIPKNLSDNKSDKKQLAELVHQVLQHHSTSLRPQRARVNTECGWYLLSVSANALNLPCSRAPPDTLST